MIVSPFPFASTLNRIWWQSRAAQYALPQKPSLLFVCNMIFSNRPMKAVLIDG